MANKVGKGGPIKILVRGDVPRFGMAELVQTDIISVANVDRVHLVKGERDATGASFSIVDAVTGYMVRKCTRKKGLDFLRVVSVEQFGVYVDGMTAKERPAGEARERFRAAFDAVHKLIRILL